MASRTIGACSPGRWVNGTSPAYRSIQLSTGCSIPLSTGGFIRCDASHRRGVVTVPWISEDVGGRPAPAMTPARHADRSCWYPPWVGTVTHEFPCTSEDVGGRPAPAMTPARHADRSCWYPPWVGTVTHEFPCTSEDVGGRPAPAMTPAWHADRSCWYPPWVGTVTHEFPCTSEDVGGRPAPAMTPAWHADRSCWYPPWVGTVTHEFPCTSKDVGGRPAPAMTLRGRCLMRDVGWNVPYLAGVLADRPIGGEPADIRGVENGGLPPCLRLPP